MTTILTSMRFETKLRNSRIRSMRNDYISYQLYQLIVFQQFLKSSHVPQNESEINRFIFSMICFSSFFNFVWCVRMYTQESQWQMWTLHVLPVLFRWPFPTYTLVSLKAVRRYNCTYYSVGRTIFFLWRNCKKPVKFLARVRVRVRSADERAIVSIGGNSIIASLRSSAGVRFFIFSPTVTI